VKPQRCRLSEIQCLREHGSGEVYYEALIANGGSQFGGVGQPRVLAPSCAYRRALAWAEAKAAEGRDAA
jgi:hypothetical protein